MTLQQPAVRAASDGAGVGEAWRRMRTWRAPVLRPIPICVLNGRGVAPAFVSVPVERDKPVPLSAFGNVWGARVITGREGPNTH